MLGRFWLAAALTLGASHAVAQANTTPALSPFQRAKAETLLERKLPCLGCHALNGKGGRIGPDLSAVGARLEAAAIRKQIEHPRALMPRILLPPATLDLVISYLAAQRVPSSSPMAMIAPVPTAGSRAQQLYARHCAACHGAAGKGDGANAQYLDRPPARHADANQMRTRTDDRLFDAIFAGGGIMGGSPRMPPFGQTLSTEEIRLLVKHIRELCHCQQPTWADATH